MNVCDKCVPKMQKIENFVDVMNEKRNKTKKYENSVSKLWKLITI